MPKFISHKKKGLIWATTSFVFVMGSGTSAMAQSQYFHEAAAPIRYMGTNPHNHGLKSTPNVGSDFREVPSRAHPQAPVAPAPLMQQPSPNMQAIRPPVKPAPNNFGANPFDLNQFDPNQFDQGLIDRQLYKHQKVGKPYTVGKKTYYPKHNPDYDTIGVASWYGDKFHGKLTANGERFNKLDMTAAHKTLPLNSYVYVTNQNTGKTVKLRLNDRGPFIDNRIIDLSEGAAKALGFFNDGIGPVRVQYAGPAEPPNGQPMQVKGSQPAPSRMAANPPKPNHQQAQANPSYQPLRDIMGNQARTPQVPALTPQPVAEQLTNNPAPSLGPNLSLGVPALTPPLPANPIPESNSRQDKSGSDNGVVTLTVKGPVHLASHDTTSSSARFRTAFSRKVISHD